VLQRAKVITEPPKLAVPENFGPFPWKEGVGADIHVNQATKLVAPINATSRALAVVENP